MDATSNRATIDTTRSAHVGDAMLATVINADGSEALWFMGPAEWDAQRYGCACANCAPHEQLRPVKRRVA